MSPRQTFEEVRGRVVLKDGRQAIYRRTCCDDEEALNRMFTTLTEESLYMRYVGYHRPTREEIRAILKKEGTQEIILVATPVGSDSEIVAQIRCIFLNPPTSAEVGIVIRDDWQNQGLGTALMKAILACASRAGVERIVGIIGLSNDRMIHVCNKLGFATCSSCYDTVKMGVSLGNCAAKTKPESA
jgi:acetyltransferase